MEQITNEGFSNNTTETEEKKVAPITNEPTGEDLLIAEIDAFRQKATQLQQLIQAKERQAQELEAIVLEKEKINRELQEELNRKQAEADSLVADVETQVDRMMAVVKNNMQQLEVDIKDQVNNNQDNYDQQHRNLQDTLKSVSDGLDTIQNELSEKTHSESVHLYRLIQDLLQEHDNSVEMTKNANDHFQALKTRCTVLTVISSISIVMSAVILLVSLGLF